MGNRASVLSPNWEPASQPNWERGLGEKLLFLPVNPRSSWLRCPPPASSSPQEGMSGGGSERGDARLRQSLRSAALAGVGSPPALVYTFQLQPVKSLRVSGAAQIYGSCPAASSGLHGGAWWCSSCLGAAAEWGGAGGFAGLQPRWWEAAFSLRPATISPTSPLPKCIFLVSTLGLEAPKSDGRWLSLIGLITSAAGVPDVGRGGCKP